MSSNERKINVYKMFTQNNSINPKVMSYSDIKNKLIQEKKSKCDTKSEFENQIKKIFQQKKFFINNQYDHNGVKIFLEEKDECLKKMDLDDSILYKNLNENKKSKNEKNQYKIHKNLKISDNKEKTEIENNNQKVIDSFISSNSGSSIEKILELLK